MIPRRRPSTGWWPRGRATPSTLTRSDAYGPDSTPSVLAVTIDRRLDRIHKLANRRHSPRAGSYTTPTPIDPRFHPKPRHWDNDWLFDKERTRRAAAGFR